MPNWVENQLRISAGTKEELADIKAKLFNAEGHFSYAVLVPEDRDDERWWVDPKTHSLADEDAREDGKVFNWYDFHCDKWGCKWDVNPGEVDVFEDGCYLSISFNSPWSAPVHWYDVLVETFPDANIDLRAVDPAMDYFWEGSDLVDLSKMVDYDELKRQALVDALGDEYDIDRIIEEEPDGVDFYGLCTDDLFDPSTWYYEICVDEEELTDYKK